MDMENLSEEQVLQRLLGADSIPEKTIGLKRIGIPITIRGLTSKMVSSIRERCTERNIKRGTEHVNEEMFNMALISAATVKPNWNDPQLLTKYSASSGEEVIKRILLAGELDALGNAVLDLSGFGTELEEVKN